MSTPAERYFKKAEAGAYEKIILGSLDVPDVLTAIRNKWERRRERYDTITARIREAIERNEIDAKAGKSYLISAAYQLARVAGNKVVFNSEVNREMEKIVLRCMYYGIDANKCIGFVAAVVNRPIDEIRNRINLDEIKKALERLKPKSKGTTTTGGTAAAGGTIEPQI